MSDLLAIKFTYAIPITNVGIDSPTSLFVEGKDISATSDVLVNGTVSPAFVILSKSKLVVTIPASELNKPITSVTLRALSGDIGFLGFDLKNNTPVTDSLYVAQKFLKTLLMDSGSDIYNRTYGTTLMKSIGTVTPGDVEVIIATCVKDAEAQILSQQTPELSDSKTLKMVEISNISYSINTLSASVSLTFKLADGSILNTDFNLAG